MKLIVSVIVIAITCVFLFFSRTKNVSFSVETPQLKEGSLFIKNQEDSIVFSSSIVNGKTMLNKAMLVPPGYYTIQAEPYNAPRGNKFNIYIEPGHYSIRIKGKKYPEITTTSKFSRSFLPIVCFLIVSVRRPINVRADITGSCKVKALKLYRHKPIRSLLIT